MQEKSNGHNKTNTQNTYKITHTKTHKQNNNKQENK